MRTPIRAVGAIAAATALVLAGCADDDEGSSSGTDEPIIIGGTLGLTGAYSGPSAAYKAAYDLWVEQVNAEGGLLGRQVELRIYDDESNATTAQQLFQRLINDDEADLLLAPYTTAVGGAVVPLTERAEKILWNAGFVSAELHANSELLVTSWPYQEPEYPRPLFEYLKTLPEDERPTTLAVVTAQNPFTIVARDGYNGSGGVLNYAAELGMDVVYNEEYNQQATDLTALVQGAKDSGAEVFVGLSLPNDGALMARTVEQVDYRPEYYCQCGSQVVTLPNWEDLGSAGMNVFSTTTSWPGMADRPGLDELFAHFQQELGYDIMPAYGAGGYAILQVLQQAVEGAGTLDQQELREYLANNTFETAVGTLRYLDDGTTEFGAMLVQQQEDGAQLVWPSEVATAEVVAPYRS
ncbi:MAG TPA: amino acid ABC transporter substrate-binding protein [Natronosporangium sp.]|nr:amino acid ABC transporter substrate-binding protein [Natronosporangium sp.]